MRKEISTYLCIVSELITIGSPRAHAVLHSLSIRTRTITDWWSERPPFIATYTRYAWTGIPGATVLWKGD